MKKIILSFISREIKRYFGFLFDKGYKISNTTYYRHFGNWKIVLESADSIITIYCDRSEIGLTFSPVRGERKYQIGLGSMIFFLSQERNFIGFFEGNFSREKKKQYQRLAGLLEEYIDQITPYFGSDFENYKNDLILAQNKYNHRLIDSPPAIPLRLKTPPNPL